MTGKRIESGRTAGHEFRAHVTSEEHVYSRGNDPNGQKFLLDVARGTLFGEASAQARLQRHQHEARVDMHGSGQMEYRTDSYADSSDFPGLVVPQYLTSLFQPMAANARPLADAMRHETLSSEGLHVELATGATGVSVVVNPGELVTPTPVGNFDVAPLELDVNTIQTYATVSRQAIERGRTESALLQNMHSAMAAKLDDMLLYQTTNGLHTVATRVEWDDATPTGSLLYPKLIALVSKVEGVAKDQSGQIFLVAHPRRMRWLMSEMTDTWPLIGQPNIRPMAGGEANGGVYPNLRMTLPCGTEMIGDFNISILGLDGDNPPDGGTIHTTGEDSIFAVAKNQSILFEETNQVKYIRAEQPAAPQLGILYVLYQYAAFTHAMLSGVHFKLDGTGTNGTGAGDFA